MDHLLIFLVTFFASALTLFSGFGLGTVLLPVLAIFFPINIAVAMTAIIHLLNNVFKLVLMGKYAHRAAVLRFGLPAIGAAFLGALALAWIANLGTLMTYSIADAEHQITPMKLTIAVLMIAFAIFEIHPKLVKLSLDRKFLPLGGLLSGFFGGLSGHQGALRSMFLIKYGLTKESFIGTGVVIACFIDISRLAIYSSRFFVELTPATSYFLGAALIGGFSGAFIGSRLLKKITIVHVQRTVAVMLILMAFGLAGGII